MRTNKYFTSGVAIEKNFILGNPAKQTNTPFQTGMTITSIEDATPPEDIIGILRAEIAKFVSAEMKREIKPEQIQFVCISLIDSFTETP
jgi:hypothetical protein